MAPKWRQSTIFSTTGSRQQQIIAYYPNCYPKLKFEISTIKNAKVRKLVPFLTKWHHFWCRDAIFGTKGPRRQWIIASYYDLYQKLEFEIHTIKNVEVRKLAPFLTKWRCGTIFGARRFRKQRIMFFCSITKNPNLKSVWSIGCTNFGKKNEIKIQMKQILGNIYVEIQFWNSYSISISSCLSE